MVEETEKTEIEKLQENIETLKQLIPPQKSISNLVELSIYLEGMKFIFLVPNNAPFDLAHKALSKLSALITLQEEQAEKVAVMQKRVEETKEEPVVAVTEPEPEPE